MPEGQSIGTFFVIRSGNAELWQSDRRLGTLGTGDCFGEIDPTSSEPQRVSVVASSPMRLLTFSSFGIERLCAAIPDARERILASLPGDGAEAPESPIYAGSQLAAVGLEPLTGCRAAARTPLTHQLSF